MTMAWNVIRMSSFAVSAVGQWARIPCSAIRTSNGSSMTANGSMVHSHVYHVAMLTSVCVAGLTFVALVVVLIVTQGGRVRQTVAHTKVWRRIKVALILATAAGLFASVPFALATGAHSIASFLVWEAVYAGVIALGAFLFAWMVAHIATAEVATGQIEYGDCRVHETGMFDDDSWHTINPASGLPMNGSLDLAGNPFGWDSRIHGD